MKESSDEYPFSPRYSMFWNNHHTSYDEAVTLFEAQSDECKKMNCNPMTASHDKSHQDGVAKKNAQQEPVLQVSKMSDVQTRLVQDPSIVVVNDERDEYQENVFILGWCQVEKTESQDLMWSDLFTEETSQEKINLIKRYNTHLNSIVRQDEIVIIPINEPKNEQDKKDIADLQQQAKPASVELVFLQPKGLVISGYCLVVLLAVLEAQHWVKLAVMVCILYMNGLMRLCNDSVVGIFGDDPSGNFGRICDVLGVARSIYRHCFSVG